MLNLLYCSLFPVCTLGSLALLFRLACFSLLLLKELLLLHHHHLLSICVSTRLLMVQIFSVIFIILMNLLILNLLTTSDYLVTIIIVSIFKYNLLAVNIFGRLFSFLLLSLHVVLNYLFGEGETIRVIFILVFQILKKNLPVIVVKLIQVNQHFFVVLFHLVLDDSLLILWRISTLASSNLHFLQFLRNIDVKLFFLLVIRVVPFFLVVLQSVIAGLLAFGSFIYLRLSFLQLLPLHIEQLGSFLINLFVVFSPGIILLLSHHLLLELQTLKNACRIGFAKDALTLGVFFVVITKRLLIAVWDNNIGSAIRFLTYQLDSSLYLSLTVVWIFFLFKSIFIWVTLLLLLFGLAWLFLFVWQAHLLFKELLFHS